MPAVTADSCIESRAGIEHVGGVQLLGFLEALHQAIVRWTKFRLIQIIVNGFSSDGVAEADFQMFGIIDKALPGRIVEGRWSAFLLELSKAQVTHRSPAL